MNKETEGIRASRQLALTSLDEVIKLSEAKTKRLQVLRNYLESNSMPSEVEEVMWALVINIRGGYYI